MHIAERVKTLPAYPFAVVDEKVAELRKKGVKPADFGVGDPTVPTPALVRDRLKTAVDERADSGYPSYIGSPEFRGAGGAWIERSFGVRLDPAKEVTSTIGGKEGIFHFPLAFLEPGDVALCPSPGYPPYSRGTLFAGGRPYFFPLLKEQGYLPDLDAIPTDALQRARILWLCYPNAPAGALAPLSFLKKAVAWGRDRGILVVNDEAYTDIWFEEKPHSILECGTEGVVAFFSLSKRSAMTGWRIGFTAGDAQAIAAFRKVKTNIDSGTPTFIQDAAVAALADEGHVEGMRREYRAKRDLLAAAFRDMGFEDCAPKATIHYWQRLPMGLDPVVFSERLLDPEIAVVCTPGPWVSEECDGGAKPGARYVRFAMVASLEDTRRACDAMRAHKSKLVR